MEEKRGEDRYNKGGGWGQARWKSTGSATTNHFLPRRWRGDSDDGGERDGKRG